VGKFTEMKTWQKIFTNPIGIAINLVHLVIVVFAFITQDNPLKGFGEKICLHCDYTVFNWLLFFNVPSFTVIELIDIAIYAVFGKNLLIDIFLGFILVFLIISQWFFVGFIISRILVIFKSEEIKIPLE
jgi:hypothetical protein